MADHSIRSRAGRQPVRSWARTARYSGSARALALAVGALLGALAALAPAVPADALIVCVSCSNPPPPLRLATTGLVWGRDFAISPPGGPRTVDIGRQESFVVSATTTQTNIMVRLVGSWTLVCADNGNVEAHQAVDTGFAPSPARYSVSIPCAGDVTRATLTLHAEGRDSRAIVASTSTATFDHLSRVIPVDVVVHESDTDVPTGLTVLPGDSLIVLGRGSIWSGVWFGPSTEADGDWPNNRYGSCTNATAAIHCQAGPGYPAPSDAPRYSLLAGTPSGYFFMGVQGFKAGGNWGVGPLVLRTNDDSPGNGSGQFNVHVALQR